MSSNTTTTRRWLFAAALAVAIVGLIAALLIRGDDATDADEHAPATTDAAGPAADAEADRPDALPADAEVDLTGTWAHRSVQTSLTDLPVGGEVESESHTYRITTIEQSGRQVDIRSTTCESTIEGDSDTVTTRIPEAFIDGLDVAERTGRLEEQDGRLVLKVDHQCGVYGAELDDEEAGDLPTTPDAPTVVDDDGDGEPGVTVHLEGMVSAKLNIVQRGCDSYVGGVLSKDRVRGTVDWSADQELLKSNSMLIGSSPPSRPHPDAQKSWFEMRRVEGGMGCGELMDRNEQVF